MSEEDLKRDSSNHARIILKENLGPIYTSFLYINRSFILNFKNRP